MASLTKPASDSDSNRRPRLDQFSSGDKKVNAGNLQNVPPSQLLKFKHKADFKAPKLESFGLENEADKWFSEEEERKKATGTQYTPYESTDGEVPPKCLHAAFQEYGKRLEDPVLKNQKVVVLVATGVAESWVPNEDTGRARFLIFPHLAGAKGALFITYMPGPEHGVVDGSFANLFGMWTMGNPAAKKHLSQGQSSGGYGKYQPDKRSFPKPAYRDREQDIDNGNKSLPCSRFIWEIEYNNRDPVEIRQRGKKYMQQSEYTRLFLAAKFYEKEADRFEACIVLWEKTGPNDDVVVRAAVSFGTKDLSDEHKQEFSTGTQQDRLVGVAMDGWLRPRQSHQAEWVLTIPHEGLFYKVRGEVQPDGSRPYLTLTGIGAFQVDLHYLASEYDQVF